MSRKPISSYLENTLGLLIEHFGIGPVRSALDKVSNPTHAAPESHPRQRPNKLTVLPNVSSTLEELRPRDPERFRLLEDFYTRLKNRSVLPEAQDIYHFAQLIGLKEISGKSRKDMVPKLMRILLERPTERLRQDIEAAASVSERDRKEGYSILTDKMLSGTG